MTKNIVTKSPMHIRGFEMAGLVGSAMNKREAKKPSANFMSKVPRDFQKQVKSKANDEYQGQDRGTIGAQQQQLAMKTVQKMFAGRQEQHTVNVHKLVRINRLKQLNKLDPLINSDLAQINEQSPNLFPDMFNKCSKFFSPNLFIRTFFKHLLRIFENPKARPLPTNIALQKMCLRRNYSEPAGQVFPRRESFPPAGNSLLVRLF